MRSASLGTGTDRFRRPGGRWRPKRQSVGRRPVLLLTGIRYETARGPPHGSGRASSGSRSISPRSSGMRFTSTSAARASGQTRRAEGSKRRKAIQRPDPPTAMVRRRDERPLIAIRVGHERLDAPALVLRLAEPGNVVLL